VKKIETFDERDDFYNNTLCLSVPISSYYYEHWDLYENVVYVVIPKSIHETIIPVLELC
jgi:hypothetical protein